MKKLLTNMFLLSLVCSFVAFAQTPGFTYKFEKSFPDTNLKGGDGHGIVVDPEGKVWIQKYYASDSVQQASGKYIATRVILVYKPDGTPASFSPIKILKSSTFSDTLSGVTGRGMDLDQDGNIVASVFSTVYRINYKTGAALGKVVINTANGITKPACDKLGEIFVTSVFPGQAPVKIFDQSYTDLGNALDTTKYYSRTVMVSADGNDVYYAGYSGNVVLRIHCDNGSLGPYAVKDTLFKGLAVESMAWHPKTGALWVSSGSNTNPNSAGLSNFAWYAYNVTKPAAPVDSFKWNGPTSNDPRPRGIFFSPTGDTVYVCQFNDGKVPIVQRFIKTPTAVRSNENTVVTNYTLGQNYPNPFNPSTSIRFTLPQANSISLKVYDVLGKEVATIAEGRYEAGVHSVSFDAKNLNSGVYFYTLRTSGGFTMSNKMMLMK